jgi:5-methylcytosine-specific restriction endonuclease McrA
MATKPKTYQPRPVSSRPTYRPREHRLPASQRGYDSQWSKIRDMAWGDRDKVLCDHCKARGLIRERQILDHIIPHHGHGDPLLLDYANVRGLCRSCHTKKTDRHDRLIRAAYDALRTEGKGHEEARTQVVTEWRHRT